MTSPLSPDTDVGGFRIKRLVGVGATGEIYQAIDERLGRLVALKLLKPAVVDELSVQRFVDEARLTARFSHPHIVTVFAAGSFQGLPWLALEYLDSGSLRSRLDAGSVSAREAMRLMKGVCEGVAEAHRHQVVHADLKPENVILPTDGRLRVLDFGLSRLMGSSTSAASGTPAYMAPERWLGHPPTPAMDVWAIGVMLHELIEGTRPLSERELAAFVYNPTELVLGAKVAGEPCAALVSRCLSIDPTKRPQVDEVALQLASMLEGVPSGGEERAPFRGLDAFSEADASDLQGRDADVDAFVELLRRQPLVPLTGPSGIGKSSFLQAGVIPRLREQDRWVVIRARPGSRPLWSLANALVTSMPHLAASRTRPAPQPPPKLEEVLAAITARPGSLEGFIARIAADHACKVLLVVDQFEELFTLASPDDAKIVVEALTCVAAVESARVVLSLRDDFLSAFAAMAPLRPFLGAITVLPTLGRAALVEAVSAPLRRVRYFVDSADLPGRIADELAGQASALPLLQFACRALWERRDLERRLVLTREYEAIGGATGALAAHAQRFLTDALPEERELTRGLMLRLVNAEGTRRPRARTELLLGLESRAEVVLDRLLAHRLLVSGRAAENEDALIELAHESLVSTWPALKRWLTETHEARKLSGEIEQASALWVSRGRRDDETWSGTNVQQALVRAEEWKLVLSADQHQFLAAGQRREAARVRRRRWVFMGSFVAVTLLAVASSTAAIAFRKQQIETLAQQKEMQLAAADMGEFDLRLETFDWREGKASPAHAPSLEWRLHAPDIVDSNRPGRVYGDADLIRHGSRVVDGGIEEHLQVRSGPAFLEILGRGQCPPSWVFFKRFPGYSERGSGKSFTLSVPSCQASLEGMVHVPAGEYLSSLSTSDDELDQPMYLPGFSLARTESTRAQFARYERLASMTGDAPMHPPPFVDSISSDDTPVVGLTAPAAERYCRFWGQRLPTYAEWQKTYRGGLELPTGKNPRPSRLTLCATKGCSNMLEEDVGHVTRVGQHPLDVSPYGHLDLQGNVSEWTSSAEPDPRRAGLLVIAGGNWYLSEAEHMHYSNYRNARIPEYIDFSLGVRCALDEN